MSKKIDEIVESVLPKNYKDWDYDLAWNHLAQAITEKKLVCPEQMKAEFIREFCNDHTTDCKEGIRWLRGVAIDMPHLLELILKFFDSQMKTQSEVSK